MVNDATVKWFNVTDVYKIKCKVIVKTITAPYCCYFSMYRWIECTYIIMADVVNLRSGREMEVPAEGIPKWCEYLKLEGCEMRLWVFQCFILFGFFFFSSFVVQPLKWLVCSSSGVDLLVSHSLWVGDLSLVTPLHVHLQAVWNPLSFLRLPILKREKHLVFNVNFWILTVCYYRCSIDLFLLMEDSCSLVL